MLAPAAALLVALCVHATLPAQTPTSPEQALDKRLTELRKGKNWATLADTIEALSPAQRLGHNVDWMMALERTARWPKLLEVTDQLLAQAKGRPDSFLTHFRGRALSELGRHSESMAWFREAGKTGDVAAYLEASNEAQAISDWKSLEEIADALVEKYPTNSAYLAMKGQALARQARYEEAETALNEVVHLNPKGAMNWADLACCYNEHCRYQDAFEAANQAVALDPRLMEGYCNRGRASFGLKHYKEGRDDYAAALALDPKDPKIVANLKLNISLADKFLAHKEAKASPRAGKR